MTVLEKIVINCLKEIKKIRTRNKASNSCMPFMCPVCVGNCIQPAGFYLSTTGQWSESTSANNVPCKSCKGTGVVWSQCNCMVCSGRDRT